MSLSDCTSDWMGCSRKNKQGLSAILFWKPRGSFGFFTLYTPGNSRQKLHPSRNSTNLCYTSARSKTPKTRKFFSEIFKSDFSFWLQGKIENLEIRKLRIIFLRFPRFLRFLSFRFATFSFFKELFFSILQYSFLELS